MGKNRWEKPIYTKKTKNYKFPTNMQTILNHSNKCEPRQLWFFAIYTPMVILAFILVFTNKSFSLFFFILCFVMYVLLSTYRRIVARYCNLFIFFTVILELCKYNLFGIFKLQSILLFIYFATITLLAWKPTIMLFS